RKQNFKAPEPRYKRGIFAKYLVELADTVENEMPCRRYTGSGVVGHHPACRRRDVTGGCF
ncbi:MAG: hypothetical protein INR62_07730, partial [Rhodospirillales bacterium]|nr:hypothetical protein [Acetobacter sp.]